MGIPFDNVLPMMVEHIKKFAYIFDNIIYLILIILSVLEFHNKSYRMGISPREPKFPTFCAMHSLPQVLADSMHKADRCGAHECLRVIGLERTESRRVAPSSGLSLES